jgi:DNA-binding SARP family transcriptional activator/tetratricopeptide (TPR) repeat protein
MDAFPNTLRLLGTFELVHHGDKMSSGQLRLEELIAMLAIQPGQPFTRSEIAYRFWPDSTDAQSRTNVRNLLYKLRAAWEHWDEVLHIDRSTVMWRQDAAIRVDVHDLETLHALAEKSGSSDERARLLTDAVDRYLGDFLPDCFADWALATRERLRARQRRALELLIDALVERRRYGKALDRARQLRSHDPLQESSYRRLMQVLALQGDRAAAVHVYHDCASILNNELGIEPAPATQELYAQLLHRNFEIAESSQVPQPIQRQRLVGRHPQWQQLQQAWREAQEGHAKCVVIWGEAGIGKTRLAEELVTWVRRQGHAWASSRSYASRGALAYAPIAEWLRSRSIESALASLDDLLLVELSRLLPDLLADRPDLPAPGPLTETWQQQRFFQGIVRALQAVPGPLLLHLDDMQWSDRETLTLLLFLLHVARHDPLLVVTTIRVEEVIDNDPLERCLQGLRQNNQLTEIHLGPLSREEMAELTQQTAEAPITAEMVDALHAASEGHPLYLIETVRGRLNRGEGDRSSHVRLAASPQHTGIAIPTKIHSLIVSRLSQLSPTAQRVVNVAAVIGRDFSYQVLRLAVSDDENALIDALDELWSRRIVREQADDSYDFSHDRIREVAYQEISRARRRLLHRRVALAIESLHGSDLSSVASELALHCAQAGESDRACQFYRQAAQISMAQHALADAEAKLDAALTHSPDNADLRFAILAEQNRIFERTLQLARWRNNLDQQEALLASKPHAPPRMILDLSVDRCHFFNQIGEGKKAVEAARSALKEAELLEDSEGLARSYLELGASQWIQSKMDEAKPLFGHAVRYAQEAGAREIEATSLEMYAASGMFSGMPTVQILDLLTQAYRLAETSGDKQKKAALLNKFGYLTASAGMGDFESIENDYEHGLALAREIGSSRTEEVILSNLGVMLTIKGDYRRARDVLADCIAMGEAHPTYWRHLVSRHYLGAMWMQMGDLDAAYAELEHASEQLSALGNRHFEVKVRCDLGLLHYLLGDYDSARQELSHVLTLIEDHGDKRFEALVSTRLGYALEACGDRRLAGKMYRRGKALHEQMGQIHYAMNALAGLARLAERREDGLTAFAHAQTVCETLKGKEMDATTETACTLRTCYTVFRDQNDARAREVLEVACNQLNRRAATIDDPEQVARFWRLADHRFFQEAARVRDASDRV